MALVQHKSPCRTAAEAGKHVGLPLDGDQVVCLGCGEKGDPTKPGPVDPNNVECAICKFALDMFRLGYDHGAQVGYQQGYEVGCKVGRTQPTKES